MIDLEVVVPELARILRGENAQAPRFAPTDIAIETVFVPARDGTRLATDIYRPPTSPCPTIAIRTPYGRASDKLTGVFLAFVRRGYAVVAQDCRGTGDSEPNQWDYYVYEIDDSYDLAGWIAKQSWFDGFLGTCGGSYSGQTQWCMATHPAVSTIAPEMSGLGLAFNTAHLHMFLNAYARSVGKGEDKSPVSHQELERILLPETLSSGLFDEPLNPVWPQHIVAQFPMLNGAVPEVGRQRLWEHYCSLSCAERASFIRTYFGIKSVGIVDIERLPSIFGLHIPHDAYAIPTVNSVDLCRALQAPPLIITGWYDWGLNDALETWVRIKSEAIPGIARNARLIITPSAHNAIGYREAASPEYCRSYRTENNVQLLLSWYSTVRSDALSAWPVIIFYLMGANSWFTAEEWPPVGTEHLRLYFGANGILTPKPPEGRWGPDSYTYDPRVPTPTVGGSILSAVYPMGSVDVSAVQNRADVLTYTTVELDEDVDVIGPLKVTLYASSTAVDTDFCARLSDVFPDGRAIQIQSGLLRARHRGPKAELLQPGEVYEFEIDLWSTANRFKAGHRIRVDVSSADFPRFDRNSNTGGEKGGPVSAKQLIYHDLEHPSHLTLPVLRKKRNR